MLHSEHELEGRPTFIGYEKKFRWLWFGTQLNTFVVAIDFGSDEVTLATVEGAMTEASAYSRLHNKGWPRGLQSGTAVIAVLLSSNLDSQAIQYCCKLKSAKKWAAFAIPVLVDSSTGDVHSFEKSPIWGCIYSPYFNRMIADMLR